MIKYLVDNGAPLGVIGFQCHFGEDLTPPAQVVAILDRFRQIQPAPACHGVRREQRR